MTFFNLAPEALIYFWYFKGRGLSDTGRFFGIGARFSKAPETCRARKAVFSSSVSKNGEVYTPETSSIFVKKDELPLIRTLMAL